MSPDPDMEALVQEVAGYDLDALVREVLSVDLDALLEEVNAAMPSGPVGRITP